MATSEPCHLLHMPRELRNMIYKRLRVMTLLPNERCGWTRKDMHRFRILHLRKSNLLLVCWQIYAEMLEQEPTVLRAYLVPKFCRETKEVVQWPPALAPGVKNLLSQVKHATIFVHMHNVVGYAKSGDRLPSAASHWPEGLTKEAILRMLCELNQFVPNAQKLTLWISVNDQDPITSTSNHQHTLRAGPLNLGEIAELNRPGPVNQAALLAKNGKLVIQFLLCLPSSIELNDRKASGLMLVWSYTPRIDQSGSSQGDLSFLRECRSLATPTPT